MYVPRIGKYLPNRVRVYEPEKVTTISEREVDPQDVGLQQSDIDAIWRAVEVYYKMGLQPAMSLCIRRNGKIILERTIGHAFGNNPGSTQKPVLATPKTLFNMFSASKCVTAMLLHKLVEEGRVDLHDPVAKYIPEFAQNNKGNITIYQVLNHSAGIPHTPNGLISIDLLREKGRVIQEICKLSLHTKPGTHQAYHALHSGFLVGEIVERVSQTEIRSFLRDTICKPLGFSHLLYGVDESDISKVAQEAFTGPTPMGPPRKLFSTSIGMEFQDAVALANHREFLTGVVPACNIIATAGEVSRFFELLLRFGSLDGVQVFQESTIRRAVAEHRKGVLDGVIGLPVRFGLGFMLGGQYLSFYGPKTPRAFGHLGFTNILAYADPQRDISVAFLNNGKPLVAAELLLWLRVFWVIGARIPQDYGGGGSPGPSWQ